MQEHLEAIRALGERARRELGEKFTAREEALRRAREVVQKSALAIRAVHRHQFQEARALLGEAGALLESVHRSLAPHPDILYAGFVEDAQKEFAEAHTTLAFASDSPLPTPEQLGVGLVPYLNGLGEAVGELRRFILDALRRGETSPCEGLLEVMDEVYTALVTIDFPDAMTGGLRRTTDMVRGVLERTRGDLTMALRQRALEERLAQLGERLPPP